MQEKLVNTKVLIRSRISKKDIQYNWGSEKKKKKTFLQNTTQKTKDRAA
jgi:hypothetical protein